MDPSSTRKASNVGLGDGNKDASSHSVDANPEPIRGSIHAVASASMAGPGLKAWGSRNVSSENGSGRGPCPASSTSMVRERSPMQTEASREAAWMASMLARTFRDDNGPGACNRISAA
jgi:hypothetical protein